MEFVDFVNDEIRIGGVSSKTLVSSLRNAGIREALIPELLGHWFLGSSGAAQPPPFRFGTRIAAAKPECAPDYRPAFVHADWVDGGSRVQAGMTPEELGFNARFHQLEDELRRIEANFDRLGGCLAGLRAELAAVAKELEEKISDLERKIFELKPRPTDPTRPIAIPSTGVVTPLPFVDPMPFPTPSGPFLGTAVVNDRIHMVIRDPAGIRVVPTDLVAPRPEVTGAGGPGPVIQPADVPAVVEGFVEHVAPQPEFRNAVRGGVTVEEIRNRFGNLPVGESGGATIRLENLLAGMEPARRFDDPDAFVDAVTDRVVADVSSRNPEGAKRTVLNEESRERTGAAVLNSGTDSLGNVPSGAVSALAGAGIDRVGALARSNLSEARTALGAAGERVRDGEVARAITAARIAAATRNVR